MRAPTHDLTTELGRSGLSQRLRAQREEGQRIMESFKRLDSFYREQNERMQKAGEN
jgi:hypothetical protein